MKRGLTPAIWLIVAIIVALSIALILIVVVNSFSSETGDQGITIITDAAEGVKDSIAIANCKAKCTSCCVTGGDCGIICSTDSPKGWTGCTCTKS